MVQSIEAFRNKEKKDFVNLDIFLKFLINSRLLFGKVFWRFPSINIRVDNSGSLLPSSGNNED